MSVRYCVVPRKNLMDFVIANGVKQSCILIITGLLRATALAIMSQKPFIP